MWRDRGCDSMSSRSLTIFYSAADRVGARKEASRLIVQIGTTSGVPVSCKIASRLKAEADP